MNHFENGRQKALNAIKGKSKVGEKYGFDVSTAAGQKRLMDYSMGRDTELHIPKRIDTSKAGDYGADPLGNGKFKMVPSGDIVDLAEMKRRRGIK